MGWGRVPGGGVQGAAALRCPVLGEPAASGSASSPLRPGVNAMLRKVAVAAASKPHVEIRQDGDQFYIKTSTTVRTTEINFKIGESFEEETVDGRKCRVGGERVCVCTWGGCVHAYRHTVAALAMRDAVSIQLHYQSLLR